jgi:hypothetical protein
MVAKALRGRLGAGGQAEHSPVEDSFLYDLGVTNETHLNAAGGGGPELAFALSRGNAAHAPRRLLLVKRKVQGESVQRVELATSLGQPKE